MSAGKDVGHQRGEQGKIAPANYRFAVERGLFDGFGVEDISINTGIPIDDVRKEVERLRSAGKLKNILGVST